jgi:hypothetical protein
MSDHDTSHPPFARESENGQSERSDSEDDGARARQLGCDVPAVPAMKSKMGL